jgi:hypothetical protein
LEPLARLATIARRGYRPGEDRPEAAGLLALSLGLSRMFDDDHAQLEAGMLAYDALYRWSRDARDEAQMGVASAKTVGQHRRPSG